MDLCRFCTTKQSNTRQKECIRTTILGGKAVDGVISLGLGTDVSRKGIGGEGAVEKTVLINTSDVDLDRGVVLGANEAVSGGAEREKKKEGFCQFRSCMIIFEFPAS